MLIFFIFVGILSFEYGLYLIQGNSLSIDNLTAFFLYCKIIYNGFFNVVKFIRNFTRASILADKLFNVIAPRYAKRNGGYTQIIKKGPRRGDSAETVILKLV